MKNFLPYADVMSVDDYFALPKEKRQKYGLYLKPYALPCELFDTDQSVKGWEYFSREIRKQYPVQGFIREWLFSYDNPVYSRIKYMYRKIVEAKYAIKHFINPAAKRWRAAYPRHKYRDIDSVIEDSNFGLLLDFWYDEVDGRRNSDFAIDWNMDDGHAKFYAWLAESVKWIEVDRKTAHAKIDSLYDAVSRDKTYEQNYDELNSIEASIEKRDTEVLTKMIEYRNYFWT